MKKQAIPLAGLILLGALSLNGCSSIHQFLNPPKFSAPVTATPATPLPSSVPTFIAPGAIIAATTNFDHGSTSVTFRSQSIGFTVHLSCSRSSTTTRVKVTATIQGASETVTNTCTEKTKTVLSLITPEAPDDKGIPVKLAVTLTGKQISGASLTVTSGTQ